MKLKIMMAVLAVVFLSVGSAMAIPYADYEISGNEVTYNVINDLSDFSILKVGFGPITNPVVDTWVLTNGVTYRGKNGDYWFNVPGVYGTDSIKITYNDVPDFVNYTIWVAGLNPYGGTGAVDSFTDYVTTNDRIVTVYGYAFSGRFRIDPVPEPASLIILGIGLLGIAGLKKKLQK